jgi:Matrixin
MKLRRAIVALLILLALLPGPAQAYVTSTTVPAAGGCPQLNRWNISAVSPLNRQWSTALPSSQILITFAYPGGPAQMDEIAGVIEESYAVWSGVSGATINSVNYPGTLGPLGTTAILNACTNDALSNADGLNTICFDQSSDGFTTGVLAFTRTIVADAPGVTVGASATSTFAGQILDADIFFRNDGTVSFATPAALATAAGANAYDLESILIHEIGHLFGLEESGIWASVMSPFAAPPGTYSGMRPNPQDADAPLADDDRTGLRNLYPDPLDAVNVGTISGRVLPANPFALAIQPPPSLGQSVTGIFGTQVVAVDAATGAVIAGTLGGWSCSAGNPPAVFDGSFNISRLPLGRSYNIYVEPWDGLATASSVQTPISDLCSGSAAGCTSPTLNTNFTTRMLPATPAQ